MTLVQRYLNAVRFFLPSRDQDDIVRELSENIQAELDDRAADLGRAIGEAEVADLLRRHGHPALVAARYAPQRHLVGPVLFPIYLLALKFGLGVALVITTVVAVASAAAHGPAVFLDRLLAYPAHAVTVVGWTTITFGAVELMGMHTRIEPDWDPRRLPDWMAGARRELRPHDRGRAVVDVIFGTLAVGWLLLLPQMPWLAFGSLASVLTFAPIWHTWYAPLVTVAIANLLVDAYGGLVGVRAPRRLWLKLGALVAQALIVLAVSSGRVWIVAGPGAPGNIAPPDRFDALLAGINTAVGVGLAVVFLITLIEIAKLAWRLRRRDR